MRIKCRWHTFVCTLDAEGTCFAEQCDYSLQDCCPSAKFTDGTMVNGLHIIYRYCVYGGRCEHIVEREYKRFKYDEEEGVVLLGGNLIDLECVDYLACDGVEYIVDGDKVNARAQR